MPTKFVKEFWRPLSLGPGFDGWIQECAQGQVGRKKTGIYSLIFGLLMKESNASTSKIYLRKILIKLVVPCIIL